MASVAIIFETEDNKILLQLRDKNANNYPEKWGLFGGSVEFKETPIQAIIREIKEELGINLKKGEFKLFTDIINEGEEYFIFKSKFIWKFEDLELREGKDMGFFSKEEILKLNDIIPVLKKFLIDVYWS